MFGSMKYILLYLHCHYLITQTKIFIMKFFLITLQFDYGKFRIITSGADEQSAKDKVCKSENCPLCAIIACTPHSGVNLKINN